MCSRGRGGRLSRQTAGESLRSISQHLDNRLARDNQHMRKRDQNSATISGLLHLAVAVAVQFVPDGAGREEIERRLSAFAPGRQRSPNSTTQGTHVRPHSPDDDTGACKRHRRHGDDDDQEDNTDDSDENIVVCDSGSRM